MSESYQAIYDAVRSRISGGNISDAAESVMRDSFGNIDHLFRCAMQDVACNFAEYARPSAVFKPKLFRDGDQWCALFGEDIQEGICGFGDTPNRAMTQFDIQWLNEKAIPAQPAKEETK